MKRAFGLLAFFGVALLLFCNCGGAPKGNKSPHTRTPSHRAQVGVADTAPKVSWKDKFPFLKDSQAEDRWVDSLYSKMDFFERAGQLFMVSAYSNKDTVHTHAVSRLIRDYKIGGLIFFQGGPVRQAKLTNHYQAESKVPLFIGIDAEWGLNMRLDSTYKFPYNMTLGAIRDKTLLEKVGRQMGKESKRMGVQFNFSPVLDINTNPKNPIIGFRSFGESRENVTESAIALMKGVQGEEVFSTGKHFPGHGDTEADSHYALPLVNFSRERLEQTELYPYKRMFEEGLASVMVAHLNVPSLEPRTDFPSSLSEKVVTGLLQKELGFDGLVFTDALNMKAAANFRMPGEIDLDAFMAGNDILLFSEDVPTAIEKLCVAHQDSILTDERLERSVKKILHFKYKAGLNHYRPIETENLVNDLNPPENNALQYELFENAVTVLKNAGDVLPISDLTKEKIAYVKMGDDDGSVFLSTLKKYTEVTEMSLSDLDTLSERLKGYTKVIIGFHKSDRAWKSHAFSDGELLRLRRIASEHNVILDVFTKPYALLPIDFFGDLESVIVSHQNNQVSQQVSAEIIFGAVGAKGVLPVSIGTAFKTGEGIVTQTIDRLGFTAAENVGMDSRSLSRIDSLAQAAIAHQDAPGMQILVARHGKVVYQKSFGHQTYEQKIPIENADLYDLASMTKILSTLPHLMQQFDQNKLTNNTTLGEMLPEFAPTGKAGITFKALLSHYAGLEAWIPFYKSTLDAKTHPLPKYYRKVAEEGFRKKVADSLFILDSYNDTIINKIKDSKLATKIEYKYSDFTFILLKQYLEETYGKPLDQISQDHFYGKLGANNTLYNPLDRFYRFSIVPTEDDTYFRHQRLQGHVHDMAAAMQGGVGGHAGLFSNAMDVAKIMQLYLWKGHYGGNRFFSAETFDNFNTCHYCAEGNRRGLGFDKPQLPGKAGPTCDCVSPASFGHTGFTGTICWADPLTDIIYVFLSNRSFPDSNAPNKLSKDNVRENIQRVIQESIIGN